MSKKFQAFLKKTFTLSVIIGIVVGGVAGYIYYHEVGCSTNSCPITSNPWKMTGMGILIGYLVGDIFSPKKPKQKNPNTENS